MSYEPFSFGGGGGLYFVDNCSTNVTSYVQWSSDEAAKEFCQPSGWHCWTLWMLLPHNRGFSNVPWRKRAFGPGTKYRFLRYFWAFQGACVRRRGRPWYGTSARAESHFTCSSPRRAPRVVGHVYFEFFWGILRGPGEGRRGAPGTVPLQNAQVTSRKACLRNADTITIWADFWAKLHTCAGTPCRATRVAADFLTILGFSGVAAVSRYIPP